MHYSFVLMQSALPLTSLCTGLAVRDFWKVDDSSVVFVAVSA